MLRLSTFQLHFRFLPHLSREIRLAGGGELLEWVVDVGHVEGAVRMLEANQVVFETREILDQLDLLHLPVGQRLLDVAQLGPDGVNLLHGQGVGLVSELGTDPGRREKRK